MDNRTWTGLIQEGCHRGARWWTYITNCHTTNMAGSKDSTKAQKMWQPSRINPVQVRLSLMESFRTSTGLTLKAVRNPTGPWLTTIFHRIAFQQVNLCKEGGFIQPHTTEFAEANRDKRLYRQFKTKQRKILQGQEISPHSGTNVARYKRVTPCPLMFLSMYKLLNA